MAGWSSRYRDRARVLSSLDDNLFARPCAFVIFDSRTPDIASNTYTHAHDNNLHAAEEVALADLHAVVPQDVVCRRDVKEHVWNGPPLQKR